MELVPAAPADFADVAVLVNAAYRGEGEAPGWTDEGQAVGGSRTSPKSIAEDLAATPDARLLIHRDPATKQLMACVWLQPGGEKWYLGMLSVRPAMQDQQLGRRLLEAAETYASARGAKVIRITVVNIRDTLISWYERRGFVSTGEIEPFPYDNPKLGKPLRDDLAFVVMEKPV